MQYSYIQPYNGWFTPKWMEEARQMEIRARVFDLTTAIDSLEPEVWRDREYTVANTMLGKIGVKTG